MRVEKRECGIPDWEGRQLGQLLGKRATLGMRGIQDQKGVWIQSVGEGCQMHIF